MPHYSGSSNKKLSRLDHQKEEEGFLDAEEHENDDDDDDKEDGEYIGMQPRKAG